METAEHVADEAPTPETLLADRQELDRAMAAIAALPTSLKEVLILRTVDGFTQPEAAAVLGVSEKAIETRLYRARLKLTEVLRD